MKKKHPMPEKMTTVRNWPGATFDNHGLIPLDLSPVDMNCLIDLDIHKWMYCHRDIATLTEHSHYIWSTIYLALGGGLMEQFQVRNFLCVLMYKDLLLFGLSAQKNFTR